MFVIRRTQVESQIKVRDFSKCQVTMAPAEFSSWSDARSELMMEAKKPLKAQLQAELSTAANDDEREQITSAFASREKALEHDLDHKPMGESSPAHKHMVHFEHLLLCPFPHMPIFNHVIAQMFTWK